MDVVPVIATADEALLEDALRWCAALGATPEVVVDVSGVHRTWRAASVVLVGTDLADRLSGAGLPRRDHVLVVQDARAPDPRAWQCAVGVGAVDVVSAAQESTALELLALALDGRSEGCLVSVVGAVGGIGASTFAAALGHRAGGRGLASMLLDLDALGGGLDLVLGAERAEGVRWQGLGGADGTLSAGSLAEVLPRAEGLATLTWSRDEQVSEPPPLAPVLTAAARGFDLVVADAPRHGGEALCEVVGRSVCTVVLVPEDARGIGAAAALVARLEALTDSVAVLSVHRRGGPGAELIGRVVDRPVLGRIRHERRVQTAIEQGHGPRRSRSLSRASDQVLDLLGLAPEQT